LPSFKGLLEDCISELEATASSKNVMLEFEPDLPSIPVLIDVKLTKIVVTNLIASCICQVEPSA
jgi:signal transduction histidine kinase